MILEDFPSWRPWKSMKIPWILPTILQLGDLGPKPNLGSATRFPVWSASCTWPPRTWQFQGGRWGRCGRGIRGHESWHQLKQFARVYKSKFPQESPSICVWFDSPKMGQISCPLCMSFKMELLPAQMMWMTFWRALFGWCVEKSLPLYRTNGGAKLVWLVVSTHLKHLVKIASFPEVGVNIKMFETTK